MSRARKKTAVQTCNATGGNNCWATPRAFVAAQEERLGASFALDCAATRETRVCPTYFGPDHGLASHRDALAPAARPWRPPVVGPSWLNPPYSRTCTTCPDGIWKGGGRWPLRQHCAPRGHRSQTIDAWMHAAAVEGMAGAHPLVVLVPSRTSERWFHTQVVGVAARVWFVRGRIGFCHLDADGALVPDRAKAPFPSIVIDYVPGHVGPTAFGTMGPDGRVLVDAVPLAERRAA